MIKNIRLFCNQNNESLVLGEIVKNIFTRAGFNIVDNNFDLGVAIGGDGSFLRMVKATGFNSIPYYVGINTGTLGFLQEVKKDEIEKLIDEITSNKYQIEEIGIQETNLYHDSDITKFYSLNEILIRDEDLRALRANILIENDLLESFNGDGILIATSTGSTAHNLSYGGGIVYHDFSTLQITPIGPINSKSYQTLSNSVIIPSNKEIVIIPCGNKNIMITIDGINNSYQNVESINTTVKDKKIKCLRFSHYNFPQKINEKLLSIKN